MGCSKYYLLQVTDATSAKKFLGSVASNVTHIKSETKDTRTNIGFTISGLKALGLTENNATTFTREFREGMVTPHRQRLLADFDNSDPQNWQWGGPKNERIDLILLIFGKDESIADSYFDTLKENISRAFNIVHILKGNSLPNNREPFGFRDGISQPAIIGSGITGINNDNIKAGEFIMGYKNEYDIYPDTALLKDAQGEASLLKVDEEGSGCKDIGRNGTYFVLRQLEQDIDGFWNFLKDKTKENGPNNNEESIKLAAKFMGRWPSGAPLVKHPDKDPGGDNPDNDFYYSKDDELGYKCPIGAHIRRVNPRDHFEETGPAGSLKLTRRHRLMRRIRSYGEPFVSSPENHKPNGEVGLLFGCFNADISRQFEFIQYTWANYPKFKRLYADPDPFVGIRDNPPAGSEQNFTIPTPTVNKTITGLKNFVTVKGGAYFFFPSVSALKFLGTI
jgi:Dyp-type peroxidase family